MGKSKRCEVSDSEIFRYFVSCTPAVSPSYRCEDYSLYNKDGYELLRWVGVAYLYCRVPDELQKIPGGVKVWSKVVNDVQAGIYAHDCVLLAHSWKPDEITKELGQPDWRLLDCVQAAWDTLDDYQYEGKVLNVALKPRCRTPNNLTEQLRDAEVIWTLQDLSSIQYAICGVFAEVESVRLNYPGLQGTVTRDIVVRDDDSEENGEAASPEPVISADDFSEITEHEEIIPLENLKRVTPYPRVSTRVTRKSGKALHPEYPWYDELFADSEPKSFLKDSEFCDDVNMHDAFRHPNIFPWNEEVVKKYAPKPSRRRKKIS